MEMKALTAIKGYAGSRPATAPDENAGSQNLIRTAALDFAATLAEGEAAAKAAMIGDADPHALVTALAQTELAVETAVTVRNRVVEAYQEILRMPV